jgi:hypothetical protein
MCADPCIAGRHALRDHAADRQTHHGDTMQAERVEQRDRVDREPLDARGGRIVVRRRIGEPVTAHVVAQHAVLARERVDLLVPHVHVRAE